MTNRDIILKKIEEMTKEAEENDVIRAADEQRDPVTIKEVDGFAFEGFDDLIWNAGFIHGLHFALGKVCDHDNEDKK